MVSEQELLDSLKVKHPELTEEELIKWNKQNIEFCKKSGKAFAEDCERQNEHYYSMGFKKDSNYIKNFRISKILGDPELEDFVNIEKYQHYMDNYSNSHNLKKYIK